MSDYIVTPCSPAEAEAILARLGSPTRAQESMLKGFVDAVCREADGSVAWEVHQANLLTDFGRRRFMLVGFPGTSLNKANYLFTSPGTESPLLGRTLLPDDGNASSSQVTSVQIAPAYDTATLTNTWNNTFAAPAANRTIGLIGLTRLTHQSYGVGQILAYTLLSPAKVQTTTQTLEVQYRITLTPSY